MSKRYTLLLFTSFLLFVFLFLILCFHSRLATDDYYTIWSIKNNGIFNNVKVIYDEWLGRYSAVFFNSVIFGLLKTNQQYYFLLPLLSYILLVASVFLIFRELRQKLFYELPVSSLFIFAGFFTILFFFLAFDIGESWFWYCSLSAYILSIIAFLLGIFFILKSNKNVLSFIGIIVCFLYVGGASEVYSSIFLVLLLIILIYRFKKRSEFKLFIKSRPNQKLALAFFALLLSFSVTLSSPGNLIKEAFNPDFDLSLSSYYFARMAGKLVFWFFPMKIIYIVVFTAPFIELGNYFRNRSFLTRIDLSVGLKFLILILLLGICIVFVSIAGLVQQSGEYRVWTIISFLSAICFCFLFFSLGYKQVLKKSMLLKIKQISLLLGIVILSYHLINQYIITKKYAEAQDKRINYLLSLDQRIKKDTLICLKPLPECGMLYSAEISADTTHFTNMELRIGYNLKYHVISEKKKQ